LSLLCASSALSADDKEGGSKMDGTWLPTDAVMAGKKLPDEVLKTLKLVLKGDKYTVTFGKTTDQGTVKKDTSVKPIALDIVGTEGPNKGKTILAICECKDDTLKVCYDMSGKARPTAFESKPDTQLFLATYKREKP
jgi:uncharacterized protein (TIGR03067 family)